VRETGETVGALLAFSGFPRQHVQFQLADPGSIRPRSIPRKRGMGVTPRARAARATGSPRPLTATTPMAARAAVTPKLFAIRARTHRKTRHARAWFLRPVHIFSRRFQRRPAHQQVP